MVDGTVGIQVIGNREDAAILDVVLTAQHRRHLEAIAWPGLQTESRRHELVDQGISSQSFALLPSSINRQNSSRSAASRVSVPAPTSSMCTESSAVTKNRSQRRLTSQSVNLDGSSQDQPARNSDQSIPSKVDQVILHRDGQGFLRWLTFELGVRNVVGGHDWIVV
jgi:hypothetical protein